MISLIIKSFYLILPAYLANMAPPLFGRLGWLEFLNRPVDGGKKLGDNLLFGKNKTWRGLAAAVIFGVLTTLIQLGLSHWQFFRGISLIDYSSNWLVFGLLAGSGAILGDLAKSFFKRRLGRKPGTAWPVFDQLDFVVGFFIFTWWLVAPTWLVVLVIVVMTLILQPLVNILAYIFKFKKVWW
ncbi:MAG: CDP-2,3-bis-(O-geranylgeranyl)-sn-glycerol synthase [Patescibacteria group bacterium]